MEPEVKGYIRATLQGVAGAYNPELVDRLYALFTKELESQGDLREDPFFEALRKATIEYVNYLHSPGYHPDSVEEYEKDVFEKAIEAYHGPDVWDGIRICQQDFDLRMQARRIQRMEVELAAEKERFRKATKDA